MKKQLLLVMLCVGMFCGTEAKGQEAERLSGYVQAERFTKEKLNTMLFSTSVDPHWFRKGSSFGMNIRPATAKSGMLSIRWRRRNVRFLTSTILPHR